MIKYNAGNILSVNYALERLGIQVEITDDLELIGSADKVIFPGVGEASTTMNFLRSKKLDQLIPSLKQPVLGICLGLQLMCTHSEEADTDCLGIFNTTVKKFISPDPVNIKVPHMGWNNLTNLKSKLFDQTSLNNYLYFVHSYYAEICEHTIATTQYINDFSAALNRDNFYATQFHPEKSGDIGSQVIKSFIEL